MDLDEASGNESCTWCYQMVAHEYLKNDKSDNQKDGTWFCELPADLLFPHFEKNARVF